MRHLRLVNSEWKNNVSNQCMARVFTISAAQIENDPDHFNSNYYKKVTNVFKDLEIDLSPSGLFVLSSYFFLPVGIYTLATMTPWGIVISLGTTLITTGLSKVIRTPYFAFSNSILNAVKGNTKILSMLTSFFYYQTYYSLPKYTRRMAKSWLYAFYYSVVLNKNLIEKGVICIKDSVFSMKPMQDDQKWLIIEKVDPNSVFSEKYFENIPKNGMLYVEKQEIIEDHFKLQEELPVDEEYTSVIHGSGFVGKQGEIDVHYFK